MRVSPLRICERITTLFNSKYSSYLPIESNTRDYTIALYKKCAAYALSRGIIIADTKFEFGLDENGNVAVSYTHLKQIAAAPELFAGMIKAVRCWQCDRFCCGGSFHGGILLFSF